MNRQKKCPKSSLNYGMIYPRPKDTSDHKKENEMRHEYDIKNRRKWQYLNDDFRQRLKGLSDQHLRSHPASKKSYRFPTGVWAEVLGVDASTVRRELARGKSRQGSEFDGGFHYLYDPQISRDRSAAAAKNKGRECMLSARAGDETFARGVKELKALLLRKSTLQKEEGFYSVYAALEVAKRRVQGFSISEKTVWNWIRDGKIEGLTIKKVRIWERKKKAPDKHTVPHDVEAKKGHHIKDRPKCADDPMNAHHYEGDTICSCKGDTTAICSVIERTSNFQFWRKMSRNTSQCFNGAIKVIVKEEGSFESITFDNGMEMSAVKRLERIIANGRSSDVFRCFYADAYASNQRAKNEKNHVFFRRFAGHGHLSSLNQKKVRYITDFVNDYPRRKFYGKSAREIHAEIRNGIAPKIRPIPPKKWQRKKNLKLAS